MEGRWKVLFVLANNLVIGMVAVGGCLSGLVDMPKKLGPCSPAHLNHSAQSASMVLAEGMWFSASVQNFYFGKCGP